MAKKAKPGDSGVTNLSNAKEMVRQSVPKIINLKKDRTAINEEIASIRANVEAAGVPKKALDHAIRVLDMDPQDRERFDEGYAIARDAVGLSMSRSLFDMLDERLDAETKPNGNGKEMPTKGAIGALAASKAHLGGAPAPDAVTA